MQDGANEFSMEELESLFKETAQETPPVEDGKNSTETPPTKDTEDVTKTQSFARRLKEEKEKA